MGWVSTKLEVKSKKLKVMINKNTIYSYFQTDDFPTEAQFRATWDSFWHKSESIPMSQITGLNQLFQQTATVAQLNNKANVDGSNIDVSAYQEKLNITNLIATAKEEVKTELLNGAPEAFDTLKEISDWISDDETAEAAILQAIQNEATARTEADNQKLNKPTTTSNTTSYPYVVGEDGNGNSARLPAGDLGKNFFNSDLRNTTARNHTMNAGITVNTLGNPHTLAGLPNKNADITNFRKVRVQNASGLDSVVDSKNLLTDGLTSMTDAEKDAWRLASRKTNETYSTGQPQPFAVFPPIVENTDEIQDIVVVGSNLFLNNSSISTALVSLVSEATGTEYPLNVEVNQTNPSVLSFGYNFSTLPLGNYWVKIIHNGLVNINKVYIQVIDNIINEPLPNLSWTGFHPKTNTYFTDTSNTPDFINFTSNAINFTRKYNALDGTTPYSNEGNVYINSSAFNLPNDFYIELSGTCPWIDTGAHGQSHPNISMGLSAYSNVLDVSNIYIAGFGLDYRFLYSKLISDTSITLNMGDVSNFVLYAIKRGSKIILGLKTKSGILYSTYTAPSGNQFMIKLVHFNTNGTTLQTLISFAITKILSL